MRYINNNDLFNVWTALSTDDSEIIERAKEIFEITDTKNKKEEMYKSIEKSEKSDFSVKINVDSLLDMLHDVNTNSETYNHFSTYGSTSGWNLSSDYSYSSSSNRYLIILLLRKMVADNPDMFLDNDKLQKKFILSDYVSADIIGNNITEENKLLYVKLYPDFIGNIKNPTLEMQEISTKYNWHNISNIENPDKKIIESCAKTFRDSYRRDLKINSKGVMKKREIDSYDKEYYQKYISFFSKFDFNKILKESVTTKLSSYLLLSELNEDE